MRQRCGTRQLKTQSLASATRRCEGFSFRSWPFCSGPNAILASIRRIDRLACTAASMLRLDAATCSCRARITFRRSRSADVVQSHRRRAATDEAQSPAAAGSGTRRARAAAAPKPRKPGQMHVRGEARSSACSSSGTCRRCSSRRSRFRRQLAAGGRDRPAAPHAVVSRRAVPQPRLPFLRPRAEQRPSDPLRGARRPQRRSSNEGEFPSKKDNWPRLLYHRYFMLADQCEVAAPTEAEANQWQRRLSQGLRPSTPARAPERRDGPRASESSTTRFAASDAHADQRTTESHASSIATEAARVPADLPGRSGSRPQRRKRPRPEPGSSDRRQNWRQDVASGWQGGVAMSVSRRYPQLHRRSLGSVERVLVHAHQPRHALGDSRPRRRDAVLHAPRLVVRPERLLRPRTAGCRRS